MDTQETGQQKCEQKCGSGHCKKICKGGGACGGAVYGIGLIGAAFYFFPQAVGVGGFFMAILKSLVWPALLVFKAFVLLNI